MLQSYLLCSVLQNSVATSRSNILQIFAEYMNKFACERQLVFINIFINSRINCKDCLLIFYWNMHQRREHISLQIRREAIHNCSIIAKHFFTQLVVVCRKRNFCMPQFLECMNPSGTADFIYNKRILSNGADRQRLMVCQRMSTTPQISSSSV